MDAVPFFGTGFTVYFPILISVFCVFTLFNIYGYIAKLLGVTRFEYNKSIMTDDNVIEGAALLKNARRRATDAPKRTTTSTSASSSSASIAGKPARASGRKDDKGARSKEVLLNFDDM
jgi:hypothetical protein